VDRQKGQKVQIRFMRRNRFNEALNDYRIVMANVVQFTKNEHGFGIQDSNSWFKIEES
jgi:hypothetical protein